jgi:hypothetical protein
MLIKSVISSHAKSLLLFSFLLTVAIFFGMVADAVIVDFLRTNPNRSQLHAASLPFLFIPIFAVCSLAGTTLVFSFAQLLQACIVHEIIEKHGRGRLFVSTLAIPLSALLSWYCYDYLTPSDFNLGINTPGDWVPYQHGLTIRRYLLTLCWQSAVTLFSTARLRFEIENQHKYETVFFLITIGLAAVVGAVLGALKNL